MNLQRTRFNDQALARDGGRCVVCGDQATEVHHIMERRLWGDNQGYFLDNGASVCNQHHIECEMTLISVEELRRACGITKPIIPAHLYPDEIYDKWGNPILPNGMRLRGELFFDESVQKILGKGGVLGLFTNRVKQPRTFHLPWSEGVHADDRVLESIEPFIGQRVIVHEKLDGENSSLYNDYFHARSIDGRHHPSRDWVKNLWGQICHDIPSDWRIMVENLYATHSVYYDSLPSYGIGFAVWNERNWCLPWDETKTWLELLGIVPCPVLYDGIFDERLIRGLYTDQDWTTREGYVVRIADGFSYAQYRRYVGKFVRRGHIQTAPHGWLHRTDFRVNKLRECDTGDRWEYPE